MDASKGQSDTRTYFAIDLKSFYASVECMERGLNPLTTNLVVADPDRTEKTICLAVSPSLKAYGIPGRARLFEVNQRVKQVNALRKMNAPGHLLTGSSKDDTEVRNDPSLALDFHIAPPQMRKYMEVSSRVYGIYLKYIAPEDIHVYSIDEVLMDVTNYLAAYKMTARELARTMIADVLATTGITATAGIGTNLYLCKVAMDIDAKHTEPDENGVRISDLDERSYRQRLWTHRPLRDFWRIGRGYSEKLEQHGIYTMGDVARCSVQNEELLYRLFGVNAELLIDHAWGWEPCTMKEIKAYVPEASSVSAGQVLIEPYTFEDTKIIIREMGEQLSMELMDRGRVTDQVALTVNYDASNLQGPDGIHSYKGEVVKDFYGRAVPKHAYGSENLGRFTSSSRAITESLLSVFERIADPALLIRRLTVAANHAEMEDAFRAPASVQLSLFEDAEQQEKDLEKEKRQQKTVLEIRKKYGSNMLLKGTDLFSRATAKERNMQVGGHKAE
ncbi:MAG: DNA methylase [Clostridia bacterium]|nr:DNA methylase [Clostridia bacterium]